MKTTAKPAGPVEFEKHRRVVEEIDEPFRTICDLTDSEFPVDAEDQHGEFIADAFNVYHETGLSPRQLLDQRNALWDALENIKSYPIARPHPDGPSITRDHMAEIQAAIAKVMSEGRNAEPESPRFPNVSCSQCGCSFGPGDHGFSHCENHEGMKGER